MSIYATPHGKTIVVSSGTVTVVGMPALTGSVSVINSPTVTVSTGTISVVSIPAITGSVSVINAPTVTVSALPAITGTVTALPSGTQNVAVVGTPTITGTVTAVGTVSAAVISPTYINAATVIGATGTGFLLLGVQSTTSRAITLTATGAQNIWAIGGTLSNLTTGTVTVAGNVTIAAQTTGTCSVMGMVATGAAVGNPPVTVGGRASDILPAAMTTAGNVVNAMYTLKGVNPVTPPHGTWTTAQIVMTTSTGVYRVTTGAVVVYAWKVQADQNNIGTVQMGFSATYANNFIQLRPGQVLDVGMGDLSQRYFGSSYAADKLNMEYVL